MLHISGLGFWDLGRELVTPVLGQGDPAWKVCVLTLCETGVTVGQLISALACLGLFKEALTLQRLP